MPVQTEIPSTRPVVAVFSALAFVAISVWERPHSAIRAGEPTAPVVIVSLSDTADSTSDDAALMIIERALRESMGIRDLVFATGVDQGALLAFLPATATSDAAKKLTEDAVQKARKQTPALEDGDRIRVSPATTDQLQYITLSFAEARVNRIFVHYYAQLNVIPQLERISGAERVMILGGNPGAVLRIVLDPDRMRPWDLTAEQVAEFLKSASTKNPPRLVSPVDPEHPTLELPYPVSTDGEAVKEWESVVLKATAEGEIIRVRDVGQVEAAPSYPSYAESGVKPGDKSAVTIVLVRGAKTDGRPFDRDLQKTLRTIEQETLPKGMTYEIRKDLPKECVLPAEHQPASKKRG